MMNVKKITTKSFKLAVYIRGDKNSAKIAIVLPGRLDSKDYPHIQSHVELLAALGFYAVAFDPPGTWESEGDISLYSMTNYLKAINELIEYFDNRATILVGHSRGASMALFAAVANPSVIACVAIMGKLSFKKKVLDIEWESNGSKIFYRDLPENPEAMRSFNLSYEFNIDSMQYDLSDGITKLKIPKLFVAGKNDITVKPEVVQQAYDLAAMPKEYKLIESDHDYRKNLKLINNVNLIIANFIKQYDLANTLH